MPRYDVVEFTRSFETDGDVTVVAAELSAPGTRESSDTMNYALVKQETDDEYICGYQIGDNGNECNRQVDSEDALCWQHEERED